MKILSFMICLMLSSAALWALPPDWNDSLLRAKRAAEREARAQQSLCPRFGSVLTEAQKETISKASIRKAAERMHTAFHHPSVSENDVVDALLLHFQTRLYLAGKYTSEDMQRAGVNGKNYEGDLHRRALMSAFFMLTPAAYRNFSYDVHDYVEVQEEDWRRYNDIGQKYVNEICAALHKLADPETPEEEFKELLLDLF